MNEATRRSPLHSIHAALGARFTEFGGWEMPVLYSSIIEEHLTTRASVGLFDLSHMGEIAIRGPQSLEVIQELITNDASRLEAGDALYTPICLPSGGVVDDVLVYRLDSEDFLMVVNAANVESDWEWIQEVNGERAQIENQSDMTGLIAIQGPTSEVVMQEVTPIDLDHLYYYQCVRTQVAGIPTLLARTGYTGEDGFEVYAPSDDLGTLWETLHQRMRTHQGRPVGLGARDTLRLEMAYPLYGQELSRSITPLEAGLRWTVAFDKPGFIGHEALRQQAERGVERRLVGFQMTDRGIARSHYPVYIGDEQVGEVTSGGPSPSLEESIGLAYVPAVRRQKDTEIEIEVHRKRRKAVIVNTPFHPSSVRRKPNEV